MSYGSCHREPLGTSRHFARRFLEWLIREYFKDNGAEYPGDHVWGADRTPINILH